MKAARRIREYLDARTSALRGVERDDIASVHNAPGPVHYLLTGDLEEVLASRARYRHRARAEHKAAQSLLADNAALLIENAAMQEQLRKERAAVQSARDQRTEATNELSLRLREEQREDTARTAERDSILNVLYGPLPDRKSLYTNSEILQSIRALQRAAQTEEISQEFHDYRQDADTFLKNLCRALYLPLTSSAEQILQEVQRMRQDAEKLRDDEHRKLREALQLRDASFEGMISNVRELRTGNTAELRRAQDAEKQYRTLRQALQEVCAAVLPAYKDRDPGQQLSALQTALQSAYPYGTNQAGVQSIAEARAYQKRRYADGQTHDAVPTQTPELLRAALSLLTNTPDLYPFGKGSFEGILRHGGRKGQLAHAGACIAALIDLLPPAPQAQPGTDYRERRARDRAAYPGEAGDLF